MSDGNRRSWAHDLTCLLIIASQPLLACLFVWVVHGWVCSVGDRCSTLEAGSKAQEEVTANHATQVALLEERCSRHDEQLHRVFERLRAKQDEEEDRLVELEQKTSDREMRFFVNAALTRLAEENQLCLMHLTQK